MFFVGHVVSVFCGYYHSLAIDEKGNIWVWGDNAFGRFGNGTMKDSDMPVQTTRGTKYTNVFASIYCCMALDENGDLYFWGSNPYGAFGNGTNDYGVGLKPTTVELK